MSKMSLISWQSEHVWDHMVMKKGYMKVAARPCQIGALANE